MNKKLQLLLIFTLAFSQQCLTKEAQELPQLLAKEPIYTKQQIEELAPSGWPKTGLQVFPEAGREAWLRAINSAKHTIQMAAYRLSDEKIANALAAVAEEGRVKISLLIQPITYQHDKSGDAASPIETFKQKGINVYQLSSRFNQAHYKLIIIDGKWAMISTGNLDASSLDGLPSDTHTDPCRDFAITVTNPQMIKELVRVFEADISDKRVVPNHPQLVWGPDDQRSVFLKMINSAQKRIRIYQQDIQDVGIAQALAGVARDGVSVEILMMPYPFSKTEDKNIPNQELIRQAGGKVYLHTKHYIHAKIMIVDDQLMYLGSCNFYTPSIDQTRELGVITADPAHIKQVNDTFDNDKQEKYLAR